MLPQWCLGSFLVCSGLSSSEDWAAILLMSSSSFSSSGRGVVALALVGPASALSGAALGRLVVSRGLSDEEAPCLGCLPVVTGAVGFLGGLP